MQTKIIIDTNVYIDIFNYGLHEHLHNPFQYIVFLAYPVLHELWMGAKGKNEIRHLSAFQNRFIQLDRFIVPTATTLAFTGKVCQQFRQTGQLDPAHPKHYNDIVIAALGRQIGAKIITKNVKDFQIIQKKINFNFMEP